ncbi:unnamed protein product, partial [Symbiodinium pilosum]
MLRQDTFQTLSQLPRPSKPEVAGLDVEALSNRPATSCPLKEHSVLDPVPSYPEGWQISSEDMCSPNEVVSGTMSTRTWDSFYSTT